MRKQRPIIVTFARYNDLNKIFRNKKKLKGKKISITESLTANRMEKFKENVSYMVFVMSGPTMVRFSAN